MLNAHVANRLPSRKKEWSPSVTKPLQSWVTASPLSSQKLTDSESTVCMKGVWKQKNVGPLKLDLMIQRSPSSVCMLPSASKIRNPPVADVLMPTVSRAFETAYRAVRGLVSIGLISPRGMESTAAVPVRILRVLASGLR